MSKKREIIDKILKLEEELEKEMNEEFEKKFEDTLKKESYSFKEFFLYIKNIPFLVLITSPFIYMMVIPAIILDMFLWIYQNICFRVYKIPFVKRKHYIVYDRHKLSYLHPIEKLGCFYCSYFNGLMAYSSEIASRTELYFCPIRHKKKIAYKHKYYEHFVEYGNKTEYEEKLYSLRDDLRELKINQ